LEFHDLLLLLMEGKGIGTANISYLPNSTPSSPSYLLLHPTSGLKGGSRRQGRWKWEEGGNGRGGDGREIKG
jgi:hypothetical protein